ncbi:MAG: hypothetical protein LBI42_01620 [Chitinispirillales bacterium]|jgi:hypothetical protein|nr:hypothetical protein [Chitinispirillales bacterium]
MVVKQISIELKNEPNSLSDPLKVLNESNVNIRALTISETYNLGSIRLIVDKFDDAVQALKTAGIKPIEAEMLAVEIDDAPGSLYKAMETIKGINLDYAYSIINQSMKKAILFLRFRDIDKPKQLFIEKGYKLLSSEDMRNM